MGGNQTWITEVILLGFQVDPALELLLFGLFCLFYTLTLLGNGVILGLICLDARLHSPMYFFLTHLAIVDMSYASNNRCPPVPGPHLRIRNLVYSASISTLIKW
uniref:G-protein coupled receptors family 1 profile domain-containing protein n=1 Tax=Canis lupus dingo TaxID=286419 RepID=A0A8C0LB36_CANLU